MQLLDVEDAFLAIGLHNSLKTVEERKADLLGRLSDFRDDQNTTKHSRFILARFIERELAREKRLATGS